jgi:D-tyrosyl-tRNA(Tyr) deacylase
MNRSVVEAGGALLVISQFTLYGDCRKGRRPSFDMAAGVEQARALYERFLDACRARNVPVQSGVFQASMAVHLINDGPVTIICESSRQGLQEPD